MEHPPSPLHKGEAYLQNLNNSELMTLKSYTKAELAQLYSPHSEGSAALQTLYRWMRRNESLMAELEAIGYNKYRHSFLKQEVGIIVKYLGEP